MMKSLTPLIQGAALWLLSLPLANAAAPIIDTSFAQVTPNEEMAPPPATPEELPLKTPTRINLQQGSSIAVATESQGELKPPYALVKVGELPDRPEVTAAVSIVWNLKQLPLEAGRYRLSFQIAILNGDGSPGRMRIVLLTDTGKPMAGHAPSVPPVISFNGGRISADKALKPVTISPGEVYQLELTMDTQQLTWGLTVNGETLREEQAFPPEYLDQLQNGFTIGSVEYQVIGGMGDKPGAEVALGNVVFKKL